MRERDIETWIMNEMEKLGGLWLKFVSPGNDGVPDRVAIFPDGRTVFVELKTAMGHLSRVQRYQIRRLRERHQQVCVVYGKRGAVDFVRDMADHVTSSGEYRDEGYVPYEELADRLRLAREAQLERRGTGGGRPSAESC